MLVTLTTDRPANSQPAACLLPGLNTSGGREWFNPNRVGPKRRTTRTRIRGMGQQRIEVTLHEVAGHPCAAGRSNTSSAIFSAASRTVRCFHLEHLRRVTSAASRTFTHHRHRRDRRFVLAQLRSQE